MTTIRQSTDQDPIGALTVGKERSDYIRSFLHNGVGHVSSLFRHSLNLALDDRLIHVGSAASGLSVFGVTLPLDELNQLLAQVAVNDPVRFEQDQISILTRTGTIVLALKTFREVPLSLAQTVMPEAVWPMVHTKLAALNLPAGMGLSAAEVASAKKQLTPDGTDWDQWARQAVAFLLGRGKGLTPSGDDILVGYLAVAKTVLTMQPAVAALEAALPVAKLKGTTQVAQNYIRAVMDGFVSSDLLTVLQRAAGNEANQLDVALRTVLTMGHTSGHDTLGGVFIAVDQLLEESKWKNNQRG